MTAHDRVDGELEVRRGRDGHEQEYEGSEAHGVNPPAGDYPTRMENVERSMKNVEWFVT